MWLPMMLSVAVSAGVPMPDEESAQLRVTVERNDAQVRLWSADSRDYVDVTSRSGIGRATIQRKSAQWPKQLIIRLHLTGLESFRVSAGDRTIEWSVSSTGDHDVRVAVHGKEGDRPVAPGSRLQKLMRVVGGCREIPLTTGYFELSLPADLDLWKENPPTVKLQWIDFYRG